MFIQRRIYRIVAAQFVVALLAATLCLPVNWVIAYSVLLGGLTCAVPSAFMAWRFTREVADPGVALSHLIRGEIGKYALTACMFMSVFFWLEQLRVGYFFTALGLGMLCNILIPLFDAHRPHISN